MKRLNNKGFAISTIIYGLSIMGILLVAMIMAEMATIRSNTRQMSKSIEEELNSLTRVSTTFSPAGDSTTPTAQEYIVPEGQAGWYKIELWGTQGGGNGGLGAYTSGVIFLDEGEVLYFYIGKHDNSSGPGAETDVRIVSGGYTDQISYQSRIMIAAGGGPNADAFGGTLYGGQTSMKSYGGYINTNKVNKEYTLYPASEAGNPTNGTLIGLAKNYSRSSVSIPELKENNEIQAPHNGAGGDGYAPGNTSSVGGSSYIAGYAGCKSIGITEDGLKVKLNNNPGYMYHEQIFDEERQKYTWNMDANDKIYYFVDGIMLPGVNTGDGKAKIEKVASKTEDKKELTKANPSFKKVTAIRDCVDDVSNASDWVIIPVVQGKVKAQESGGGKSGRCYTYNIGQTDLDEIAVWHKNLIGKDVKNHTIEVKTNGSWKYIKGAGGDGYSETETETGIRVSAYQYDNTTTIPQKGNYYILPVLSENKVISAPSKTEDDTNDLKIEYLNGASTQKWSIELITNSKIASQYSYNVYKITELARYKSITIHNDENKIDNSINTTPFNNYAPNPPQIWKITPAGNGTYYITTVVPRYSVSINSGNLIAQTNMNVENSYKNSLIIAKNNNVTQRFRLIPIDYSSS